MNFLAHLYLSRDNEEVMIGNFIGDFVKGGQLGQYSSKIQHGIRLHRGIDSFTDRHPVVLQSKVRLREEFRHYAPVIVDVFYDHFLAKNWEIYATTPLLEFTQWFYTTISNYAHIIPEGVNHMLHYMEKDNWLFNYQYIEGIDRTLNGLSQRTKYESKMDEATQSLKDHYLAFEGEFKLFFPDLIDFVDNFEG